LEHFELSTIHFANDSIYKMTQIAQLHAQQIEEDANSYNLKIHHLYINLVFQDSTSSTPPVILRLVRYSLEGVLAGLEEP